MDGYDEIAPGVHIRRWADHTASVHCTGTGTPVLRGVGSPSWEEFCPGLYVRRDTPDRMVFSVEPEEVADRLARVYGPRVAAERLALISRHVERRQATVLRSRAAALTASAPTALPAAVPVPVTRQAASVPRRAHRLRR